MSNTCKTVTVDSVAAEMAGEGIPCSKTSNNFILAGFEEWLATRCEGESRDYVSWHVV